MKLTFKLSTHEKYQAIVDRLHEDFPDRKFRIKKDIRQVDCIGVEAFVTSRLMSHWKELDLEAMNL